MSEIVCEIKDRIIQALRIRNMNAKQLSDLTKIPKSSISQYMSGYAKPKQDRIYLISQALNVNPTWLLGYDVNMEDDIQNVMKSFDNIYPIEVQKIPMLGTIACGEPIYADEDRESYVLCGTEIKADFCLRCKGDSMVNARIYDNDIVFISKQDIVSNGEIAAVIIDDEVTLKRFYYYRDQNLVILKPENSKYEDIVLSGEKLNKVKVLGKAIAFQSDVI